jgi:hypothetical protein
VAVRSVLHWLSLSGCDLQKKKKTKTKTKKKPGRIGNLATYT